MFVPVVREFTSPSSVGIKRRHCYRYRTKGNEMKTKIMLLFLAVAFLATGCAQFKWQKYGSTQMDFNKDSYECQTEAARTYPPQFVTRQITQGYTTPSTTKCYGSGSAYGSGGYFIGDNNVNCTTTPGQHVQGATTRNDVNTSNRNQASKQCMYARGWQLIQVK